VCGIAGLIVHKEEIARKALSSMVTAQVHRGPDDVGEKILPFGDNVVGLGQRRLSILDLSPAGHQPMFHAESGDRIVFNGEIYNFGVFRDELSSLGVKWKGHSDTEVLLHGLVRWGPEFISRLEGMFAFAWLRSRERQLVLARDPLGIKPLYVAHTSQSFLFASEVRALMASQLVPRKIDSQAVAGFLAYGSIPEPRTFFQNVSAFPAGCYQTIEIDTVLKKSQSSPKQHWSFPEIDSNLNQEQVLDSIARTLDASVRGHLVSDVPVGVFLSSGLDSTIVAGLAAKHAPNLRTFTVGFSDQPDMSESHMAGRTAALLGTKHTDIQITGPEAESAALAWLRSLDQPSVDGLNTYIISRAVRAEGIVVALSGLGGDELFGGYSSFGRVPRMSNMVRRISWLPAWGRSAISSVATLGRPEAVRQKATDIIRTNGGLVELFLQCRRTMSNRQLHALGIVPEQLDLTEDFLTQQARDQLTSTANDPVADLSQLESTFYMRNTLLRDSDTNGMAHSLEIRVPLLDRRMLDLVYAIPGHIRLPDGNANKHLLRHAFRDLLRPELVAQTKRGFTLPVGRWMVGPMRDLCESGLAHLKKLDILRPEGIDTVWRAFINGPDHERWSRAFALCVLGLHTQRMETSA
jgi:asparagine synthase (glutamine-hydrolysing)